MLQDDENVLLDIIKNYTAREVLFALQKLYKQEADNFADMGFKEKAAQYADVSDSLDALHDVCDPKY